METATAEKAAPAAPNHEQAADLAALQAAAAEQPAAPGTPEPEPLPNLADEIAAMISVAVQTLKPAFPSLEEIYTKATTQAAAGAIAGVCEKHGWMQGGLFGKWGEEIACLAIVGPLAFATYSGITADLEKGKARAEKKETKTLTNQAEAVPGPESKTVTFGNQPVPA